MKKSDSSSKPSVAQLSILHKLDKGWRNNLPWPIELLNTSSINVCIKNGWAEKVHSEVGLSTCGIRITDKGKMTVEHYSQKRS